MSLCAPAKGSISIRPELVGVSRGYVRPIELAVEEEASERSMSPEHAALTYDQ